MESVEAANQEETPPVEELPSSKKRSREEASATDENIEVVDDKKETEDDKKSEVVVASVDPTTIFHLPNAPHLASTQPALVIPQNQIRNILTKSLPGSCRASAVYVVTKAAECFLTELLSSATSILAAKGQEKQEENPTKKMRLTYDDLQAGYESLKQAPIDGVTPDLEFLDVILPKRTPKAGEKPVVAEEAATDAPAVAEEEAPAEETPVPKVIGAAP